jgi:hypothetical protein
MVDLDQAAAELYTIPPERFVPRRDELVAAAKAAGDEVTARAIAACRKPTVGAWAVNRLAIERPELIDQLAALAAELADAQRDLHGDHLRELSPRRRALVESLVRQARDLAVEAGAVAGRLPMAEVESTLNAALSDPAVAAQVRAGLLLKTASYAGFGTPPAVFPPATSSSPARAARHPAAGKAANRPTEKKTANRPAERNAANRSTERKAANRPADLAPKPATRNSRQAAPAAPVGPEPERRPRRGQGRRAEPQPETSEQRQDRLAAGERSARTALDEVIAAEDAARQELAELDRSLVELRRRRDEAREELSARRLARSAAERVLELATERLQHR